MVNEELKREYVVPEMRIKRIDFSDILTNSTPEGEGQTVYPDPHDPNENWEP